MKIINLLLLPVLLITSKSASSCTVNSECKANEQCLVLVCVDACLIEQNLCGLNAVCEVTNHIATCQCRQGYSGNPFLPGSCTKNS